MALKTVRSSSGVWCDTEFSCVTSRHQRGGPFCYFLYLRGLWPHTVLREREHSVWKWATNNEQRMNQKPESLETLYHNVYVEDGCPRQWWRGKRLTWTIGRSLGGGDWRCEGHGGSSPPAVVGSKPHHLRIPLGVAAASLSSCRSAAWVAAGENTWDFVCQNPQFPQPSPSHMTTRWEPSAIRPVLWYTSRRCLFPSLFSILG